MVLFNETLGSGLAEISNSSAAAFALDYGRQLPSLALQGNFFALVLMCIFGWVLMVVLNKLTGVLLQLIRHTFVFIITGFGALFFFLEFRRRLAGGLTTETLVFGALGLAVSVVGLLFAVYAVVMKVREARSPWPKRSYDQANALPVEMPEEPEPPRNLGEFSDIFTNVKDTSLFSALAFMVVGQFGVFSTETFSAPTAMTGFIFLVAFLIAAMVFIRQSYKRYMLGVTHLIVTFVVGVILSIFLGSAWAQLPLTTLLSGAYFTTSSLVALISGMALSIFAGSKT